MEKKWPYSIVEEFKEMPTVLQIVLTILTLTNAFFMYHTSISTYDVMAVLKNNRDTYHIRDKSALSPVECADFVRRNKKRYKGVEVSDILYRDMDNDGDNESCLKYRADGKTFLIELKRGPNGTLENLVYETIEEKQEH